MEAHIAASTDESADVLTDDKEKDSPELKEIKKQLQIINNNKKIEVKETRRGRSKSLGSLIQRRTVENNRERTRMQTLVR